MMEYILSVYQHLSARLIYEGNNKNIIKTSNNDDVKCKTISTFFGILLRTLTTIFGDACLALKSIQLAIGGVFYFSESKKLVVLSLWNELILFNQSESGFTNNRSNLEN